MLTNWNFQTVCGLLYFWLDEWEMLLLKKNPTTDFTNFMRVINRIVEESKEPYDDETRGVTDDDNSESEE